MSLVWRYIEDSELPIMLFQKFCCFKRLKKDRLELRDFSLWYVKCIHKGVIEELLVWQILAPVVLINPRELWRLQDRFTKCVNFIFGLLRTQHLPTKIGQFDLPWTRALKKTELERRTYLNSNGTIQFETYESRGLAIGARFPGILL